MKSAIGLLGGSFNPVHLGHVALAQAVQAACSFDPLWIIPSQNPPHKPPYEIASQHRLAMAQLAFEGIARARISDFEISSEGPSYAIRTIEHFSRAQPGADLHFILGADAFHDLPKWYAFPDVMEACSYVVVARAGWDQQPQESAQSKLSMRLKQLVKAGLLRVVDQASPPFERVLLTRTNTRICVLDAVLPEISSTEVRVRLQLKESVAGLVPPAVDAYLKSNGLYGSPDGR